MTSRTNAGVGRDAPSRMPRRRASDHATLPVGVLQSRLRPPRPLLALIPRADLLERLQAAAEPLVVVCAPAGSGKTVALAQWAEHDPRPFTWLQIDASDNDPVVFLSYVATALDAVADVDPSVVSWLHLASPPVASRIVPTLADAVSKASPFVLVLDDAHLLTNEACWQVVAALLEHLPPAARLCVGGRARPPLPIARLHTAGLVQEIGSAELALSASEIADLLGLHGVDVGDEAVVNLERATEGWAVGVYLAVLSGTCGVTNACLTGVSGRRREVAEYLASEVLQKQSDEVARFLLQTSILEWLGVDLCRSVTGDEAAGGLLQEVAHGGLFVSALDDTGERFRYHHLFADFLQAELERRGDGKAELHRRAAAWFEDHGELEEAMRHWISAGETGRAAAIVCRAHVDTARLARYATTRRWLEMFSDEQIFADEALTIAAGTIGAMAEDTPRSRGWMRTAFAMRVGDAQWPGAPIPLRAMHVWLRAAFAFDGVTQMRADAELALALREHTAAVTQLGIAQWLTGDVEAAARSFRDAEAEGATGNVLARCVAVGYQALILEDQGRWQAAAKKTKAGQRCVDDAGLAWGGVVSYPLLLAQARIDARARDPVVRERVALLRALYEQGSTFPFAKLLIAVVCGEVLLESGDEAEAEWWMRSAFSVLAEMPDAGILTDRLSRLRDRLGTRQSLEPLSGAERRVLELLPTELNSKQIAVRLGISPETVRTHAKSIYRKLGVHWRADAVARAREFELLDHL